MSSSAQVSFISTPFSHFTTSTATSRDLCDEPATFTISQSIADFIGLWSQRALNSGIEVSSNQVGQKNHQAGSSQTTQDEISELINGYVTASSLFQTTKRQESGNKLENLLFAKVFELGQHKTAQKIILVKCDFMAQKILQLKDETSQHHLYINCSFLTRSWPLFNLPFQSKEFFNLLEYLSKTHLIQEHQLWCIERKDNRSQSDENYKTLEECSDAEELESHDKCSTASRSSVTTHERNIEILDILEPSPQKPDFELEKAQPATSSTLIFEYYEGFFVGDLDIDFNPSDNHFDQDQKPNNVHKYHQNSHHQEPIQLKLFTLPPIQNFIQPNHIMGFPSSSNFPVRHQRTNNNNVHHQASSTKNVTTKSTQSQKQKEKMPRKPKKQEEKGFKLWDMISVNGKLKKN